MHCFVSYKIVVRLFLILSIVGLSGCEIRTRVNLPECEDVVSLNQDACPDDILHNQRPKVITFSNIFCLRFIDVEYLRKQINNNPEFDFLFYVKCDNDEDRKMLDVFVLDNRLPITLFVDWQKKDVQKDHDAEGVTLVSVITDAKLARYGVACVGSPLSPFNSVMSGVKKRLKL